MDKIIGYFETWLVLICMAIMLITCILQVISNLFGLGIMWTGEILRLMLVWIICGAASAAAGKRQHLGVVFLLERLPKKVSKWVRLFTDILSIFVCAYIAVSGGAYLKTQLLVRSRFSVTGWPLAVAQIAIPLCFTLICIRIVFTIISDFSKKEEEKPAEGAIAEASAEEKPVEEAIAEAPAAEEAITEEPASDEKGGDE